MWPWPDDRLTFIYLASLAAAIAAPFLWVAWSGELAMLASVAPNSLVVSSGLAIYLSLRAADRGDGSSLIAVAGLVVFALLSAQLFRWARSIPSRDERATPRWVRVVMAVLTLFVVTVRSGLLARAAEVYPWDLRPETSTMFGIIYLGVVVYFAYAVVQPSWSKAAGQLLGFLAYTLVLAKPYLDMLREQLADSPSGQQVYSSYGGSAGETAPNMLSLAVFLSVIAFGTALTVWTLLVCRETRLAGSSGWAN